LSHWGQQCFWLYPGAVVSPGDSLNGEMHMQVRPPCRGAGVEGRFHVSCADNGLVGGCTGAQRNKENHRLMDVVFKFSHNRVVDGKEFAAPPRTAPFHIE
jgi:hypothetical protein